MAGPWHPATTLPAPHANASEPARIHKLRISRHHGQSFQSIPDSVSEALVLLSTLVGCDVFNQPSTPCPEISEAEFESALRAGSTRGDIERLPSGVLSSTFGGSMKTCRSAQGAIGGQVCRRSRDLVVKYNAPQRGVYYVKVPADPWHRFEARNSSGECRILPK